MHRMPWQVGTFGLAFLSWGIYLLDTLQMLMEYCLCVGIVSRKLTKADIIPSPVVLTNQWKGEGRESTTHAFWSKRMKNTWWWGRTCSWWEDFLRSEKSRFHCMCTKRSTEPSFTVMISEVRWQLRCQTIDYHPQDQESRTLRDCDNEMDMKRYSVHIVK